MRVAVCQYDGATTLRALPLAAGLLVASARRDPELAAACTVSIRTGRDHPLDEAHALAACDVVGLSLYTWNARYSLACAAQAKALRPDLVVIAGGPSVPRRPADALAFAAAHPTVDALVFGEGEITFPALLHALRAGTRPPDLPGVAWRVPPANGVVTRDARGHLAFGPPRPRLVFDPARFRDRAAHPHRFADTASPYLDGTFDALVADGFAPEAAIFETNRGCPFACSYCDWGQATESQVHELFARADALLAGLALLSPVAGAGPRRRDPTEAVTTLALARPDAFVSEVAAVTAAFVQADGGAHATAAAPLLADLLAWERFTWATFDAAPQTATFAWDWPAYGAALAAPHSGETGRSMPMPGPVTVHCTRPDWVRAASFGAFVDRAVAANWAKEQRMDLATRALRDHPTAEGP